MTPHEAKQRLAHVEPSRKGLTDEEAAVLFEHRADRAQARGMHDTAAEYESVAREAAAAAHAGQIVIKQIATPEQTIPVHHQ